MNNQNTCNQPDLIHEGDLLAYLDSTAPPAVTAHVQQCPYCTAQVEALRKTEQALLSSFYRADCPDPRELALFWEGKLPGKRQAEIKEHVDGCPFCQEEMAVYQESASQPAVNAVAGQDFPSAKNETGIGQDTDRLVERILETIAGIRSVVKAVGMYPSGPTPAFALSAVRGGSPAARSAQFFRAGALDIVLGYAPSDGEHASGTPTGTLLGTVTQAEQVRGRQAWLFQAGSAPAKSRVDEMGVFSFEAILPGTYDLVLEMGSQAVLIHELSLLP